MNAEGRPAEGRYPSIDDYAFIGDCHSAALVSRRGSIDWCCMPRIDSASMFGRILDWDRAGYCSITPVDPDAECTRSYLEGTMVLETVYRTTTGEVRVLDCFAAHAGGAAAPYRQLLRLIEGVRGRVDMRLVVAARFDYGEARPWIRKHGARVWSAVAGDDGILIAAGIDLEIRDLHDLCGDATIAAGARADRHHVLPTRRIRPGSSGPAR